MTKRPIKGMCSVCNKIGTSFLDQYKRHRFYCEEHLESKIQEIDSFKKKQRRYRNGFALALRLLKVYGYLDQKLLSRKIQMSGWEYATVLAAFMVPDSGFAIVTAGNLGRCAKPHQRILNKQQLPIYTEKMLAKYGIQYEGE